jgi:phage-related protein
LAWIAVQTVLNVLLIANPIGLIVVAIAAFVAAIILAYKKSDTFRAIVDGLFQMLKNVGNFIKNVLIGYFELWLTIIDKVRNAVKGVVDRLNPFKNFFGGSATVTQNLNVNSASGSSSSALKSPSSVILNDEIVARGIARILSKSDLRNGSSIGFA